MVRRPTSRGRLNCTWKSWESRKISGAFPAETFCIGLRADLRSSFPTMESSQYHEFLRWARRHTRRPEEAEDLLQACLVVAVQEGRIDFDTEENRRWFAGVLKKQAAM